jgi:hypothetical protein
VDEVKWREDFVKYFTKSLPRKPWSFADRTWIVKTGLVGLGLRPSEIHQFTGLSISTVYRRAVRLGLPTNKPLGPVQRTTVFQQIGDGWRPEEVGPMWGHSGASIRRMLGYAAEVDRAGGHEGEEAAAFPPLHEGVEPGPPAPQEGAGEGGADDPQGEAGDR